MSNEFNKEDLEFFLPETFKGLSKEYILDKIFNEKIQKDWQPKTGDVMVGPTGNIFVISGYHTSVESLGGTLYFFGGGLCNRDGGIVLDQTYSSTMNKDGLWYGYDEDAKIVVMKNFNHSKISHFRYVPYPHELN